MLRRGIFAFGIIGSRCRCFHKNFLDLRLHCSPSFIKWLFSFKLTEFDDLSFMSRRDVGAEIIITTLKIQTRWMVKEFRRASCNRRSYQGQKLSMSMAPMLPTPIAPDEKCQQTETTCTILWIVHYRLVNLISWKLLAPLVPNTLNVSPHRKRNWPTPIAPDEKCQPTENYTW